VSLDSEEVRAKVRRALEQADGRKFGDAAAMDRFIDEELDLTARHTWGGNSACVELVTGGDEYLICDMGSGLRKFGQNIVEQGGLGRQNTFNFFLSHVHWDHIMGFPFFVPAYVPGNRIRIHGCHDVLEAALRAQNSAPSFPVDFGQLQADIEFIPLIPDATQEVCGLSVTTKRQDHSGESFGFRFEKDGKSVVYATDAEYRLENSEETESVVDFFREADLVIFDSMYSLAEVTSVKEDWGHSSNVIGVDLCHRGRAKHYCMFHHEPLLSDEAIYEVLRETLRYEELVREDHRLEISSAWDGMEIRL
jgi:phosphoribosyl 1,2-cyclic phosphodiesterase